MAAVTCVLVYHDVRPHPLTGFERFAVTPSRLREQLEALLTAGFRPLSLHEVEQPDRNSGSTFAVTVDDGFDSFADHLLPVLEALGIPSTLFVPTGLVGAHPSWMGDGAERIRLLDWVELEQLARRGVDLAPHGAFHRHLDAMTYAECLEELTTSREQLECRLGVAATRLAYPYGHHNVWVRRAVRAAGFRTAYAVDDLPVVGAAPPTAVPRVAPTQEQSGSDLLQHVGDRASHPARSYYKSRHLVARARRLRQVPITNLTQVWHP